MSLVVVDHMADRPSLSPSTSQIRLNFGMLALFPRKVVLGIFKKIEMLQICFPIPI